MKKADVEIQTSDRDQITGMFRAQSFSMGEAVQRVVEAITEAAIS